MTTTHEIALSCSGSIIGRKTRVYGQFPDLPKIITSGNTLPQAFANP